MHKPTAPILRPEGSVLQFTEHSDEKQAIGLAAIHVPNKDYLLVPPCPLIFLLAVLLLVLSSSLLAPLPSPP
jgi:hypothetical protein